jgi:hypothetical protein
MDHSGGLYDFGTWAPLLEHLREEEKQGRWESGPGGLLEGEIGRQGWSIPRLRHRQNPGRAARQPAIPASSCTGSQNSKTSPRRPPRQL